MKTIMKRVLVFVFTMILCLVPYAQTFAATASDSSDDDPAFVYIATTFAAEPDATSYVDKGLSLGITYYYRVEAVMKLSDNTLSENRSGRINYLAVIRLAAPEDVTAIASGPDSIAISWSEVEGATQYNIYRCDVPFFVFMRTKLVAAADPSRYSGKGLLSEKTYYSVVETANVRSDYTLTGNKPGYAKATSYNALQINAEKIWAYGKALGMTDEQCAGVLGNMMVESGLDQTAVEGIFTEPFQIGPRKTPLFNGNDITPEMETYTTVTLFGTYAAYGLGINTYAYPFTDGRFCAGLGLIQFTGPLAEDLLKYASRNNKNWYDLDLQMAAVIDVSDTARSRFQLFMNDFANADSVYGATGSWLGIMEMGIDAPSFSGIGFERRYQNAQQWYDMLSPDSSSIAAKYRSFADSAMSIVNASAD